MDFDSLVKRYEKNVVLRTLVSLIPKASSVELAVLLRWNKIREMRLREFFDELAKTNLVDRPDLLDCDDFLHRFFSKLQFALNTRQKEKIQMFARLLDTSNVPNGELSNSDEFEDFVKIFDELSFRELRAVAILDQYSDAPRSDSQNDLAWTSTFWEAFCQQLSSELPIPIEETSEYMSRIARTACYQEYVGFWDLVPGIGKLTPTYVRLEKYALSIT